MTTVTLNNQNTNIRDVQVEEIANNTTIFRSRTWDRLKFEIEYARQKGTTANSYLIQADKTALIDPPGESFTDIFLNKLQKCFNIKKLDYVILGHINANRMTTLKRILTIAPHIQIICSKPAAKSLKTVFPQWQDKFQIANHDFCLDLGQGHQLKFISVPTPRWPDALFTYDRTTTILYTDKFFGVHVCSDALWDEDWKKLDSDRSYYFNCLHSNQTKQVETTLDKLKYFTIKYYAPNHGPMIRYSLSRLTHDYSQWCQEQQNKTLTVALFYASAYGSTTKLANAIAQGLSAQQVNVELINCELATPEEITTAVQTADGFIIGSPTLGGHAPVQIQTALGIILNTATKNKLAGVFGSYGWSGEAVDIIEGKLRDANYRFGCETLRIRFTPNGADLAKAQKLGSDFAQTLQKAKKNRSFTLESSNNLSSARTEQAVNRIIGSLCVVTFRQGDTNWGILTSHISQASFTPPGIMLSVSQEQKGELLKEINKPFVVNILKEGRNIRRYFDPRFAVSRESFADLEAQTADNNCLILTEALAHLQCTVEQAIELEGKWLIYARVNQGDLLATTGITAIVHSK
ncbi:diflavin flavoprotein [Cyanobacterium sp. Dongsha4]|uniref:diflavin flavoprotein n=1 Tax=Cyanobacterium sp. DS4 TaxID=2878255 RepID=UPI002E7FD93B|nr:diflavin flavoprotein [Cyanobacterium sp. Dongsha4]WVL01579.1 diflavin flavoprotein [Cyanobacterium sp. Dongsha4]